ncbi:uncharacterized protein LOC120289547 [Eucalyptus grandis]|uniref:uncharacterized protein LOC120289547 n=1 Tax=Eucalyptus grandis TaxID=71139 RepID=UPI00192EE6B2|nr:uncharacterized protein LOC120289547 [Eucalyptus grandis]
MRMLELMGDRMDQQAATSAAATASATNAANVANAAAATPAATLVVKPEVAHVEVPPGNVVVGRPRHKLMKQFLRLNPPTFTRAGDPEAIALWIQGLENAFNLLMCTKAEKVVLVAYQLRGIVGTWWKTTKGIVFLGDVVPEWNVFLEVFNEKYSREVKMIEFQRLRQGTMSVDQYEAKFAELSQYAPNLVQRLSD